MPIPLPGPTSLRSAVLSLDRALSGFESGRAALSFERSSADNKVQVSVNGIGRVTRVFIDPSELALGAGPLATKVKDVVNAAIAAAYASTAAAIAGFASTLGLPGLPAQDAVPPDFLDFIPTVDAITAQIIANNPCANPRLHSCTSGRVTAVVNARRQVVTLSYPTSLPKHAPYLSVRTLEAVNCAVDKSTDPDDEVTPGIVGAPQLHDLVLYAKGTLKLNDRVKARGLNCNGWGWIANAGAVETNIGVEAEIGNVSSRAKIVLRDRGKVHGFVHTEDEFDDRNDTVVDGIIMQHGTVIVPDLQLDVPFPGVTLGTIELEPNQTQTAGPGYYDKLHPKTDAQVFLSAGVYYFNSVLLEPGSRVHLNASGGPIVIWVKNAFTHRGAFLDSLSAFPRLFVGYLGTTTAVVESKYRGTLAAPNAKISISTIQNHEGAFHGKDVEVQPDCGICHRPFELHYSELPGILPAAGFPPPMVDLGFENVAGWSSPQTALLTQVANPLTQGVKSLRVSNPPGPTEVVSAKFSANLAPQGATRLIVDLFVPSNQSNGTLNAVITIPSAGINALSLGSISTSGRPQNAFGQFEFTLPAAVRSALDGTASDVTLKLVLGVAANSGPWYIDNVRFLPPPSALATLDAILSFEDQSKWSSAQVNLTTNTQIKTNLTRSLQISTAPGSVQLVSVPFSSAPLNAPLGKFRIDLWKPSNQPNPGFHGQFQLFMDIPSAGIVNAASAVVDLKPLAGNAFSVIELALPGSVLPYINGEYNDVKLKPVLNVVQNTGPWRLDFIRFV